jgi:DNA-binding LytR/AlgR family response regulator
MTFNRHIITKTNFEPKFKPQLNLRIAIVEDEPLIAFHLRSLLIKLGHDVVFSAPNPEKTLLLLKEVQPELIALDIQLHSVMNGIDLAREITRLYKIPFIFITAHADDQTMKSALSVKPLGYIFKPFSEKEIYTTLEITRQQTKSVSKGISSEYYTEVNGAYGSIKLTHQQITHVSSDKNYIVIYTEDLRNYRRKQTLLGFLSEFPNDKFLQIHKSYAVNPDKVSETSRTCVRIGSEILPVGGSFSEKVLSELTLRKSRDSH